MTGAKKPSGSQRTKSPLGNEGDLGQGVRNIMIQLARKISWAEQHGKNKNSTDLWEEHLKDPIVLGFFVMAVAS